MWLVCRYDFNMSAIGECFRADTLKEVKERLGGFPISRRKDQLGAHWCCDGKYYYAIEKVSK